LLGCCFGACFVIIATLVLLFAAFSFVAALLQLITVIIAFPLPMYFCRRSRGVWYGPDVARNYSEVKGAAKCNKATKLQRRVPKFEQFAQFLAFVHHAPGSRP
jgi:hypothetical protein